MIGRNSTTRYRRDRQLLQPSLWFGQLARIPPIADAAAAYLADNLCVSFDNIADSALFIGMSMDCRTFVIEDGLAESWWSR